MFQITVYVGISPIILLYKSDEKASSDFMRLTTYVSSPGGIACLKIEDDFGHQFMLPAPGNYPTMLEDLSMTQLGMIEYGLHQARTQAKMQQAATRDPVISATRMGQGPAVLSPLGMNGGLR